tara:strand:+ start:3129 stop:3587 length:459 start_codon:yes stop_codon:yes gene_type:complete
MKLSENLTLAEVTKSNTAIKNGINNNPSDEHLSNLVDIAEKVFQPIRDHFGVPIGITSGYRSLELNKLIGGSLTSQHSKGQALDLDADVFGGVTNSEIFDHILNNLDFDQLIWEFGSGSNPDWVHVSYKREGNRKQVLQAKRINGKTEYSYL